IRSVFQNLHQTYESLKNSVNVKESLVISIDPFVTIPFLQIDKYIEKNIKEYFDYLTEKTYNINELSGIIENPNYKLLKQESKVNIFISYSRTKVKFRDSFETAIHLLKQELLESWYDEQMNISVDWQNEIDEKLEKSNIVVCLLSKEYFSSIYCTYETQKAMEMKKIIYPILINDCAWKDTPFAKINGHYKAIEPIPKAQRDRVWNEVYEGIKKMILKH
ncbi:toll/interleukin-1 receptor domain-containing protein, partial [Massilia pinisoli]|uniref:toll/interleukin-1 receptor domain-containing protein n=1 Tax=Massilia pinisoli TaxID=1772194 RepID=UPI00362C9EA7